MKLPLLLIIGLLWLASPAKAETGPSASAWIEIDAGGDIVELRWSKTSQALSEAVRGVLEQRLRAMRWAPAAQHSAAKRLGTTVNISTRIEGEGEQVVLSVDEVRVGIGYLKLRPPRYPVSGLRHRQQVDLLAKVEVDPDGRASTIELLSSEPNREDFEAAARDALKQWRFQNETVDGEPVGGTINVPLRFSMHCQRGDQGFELPSPAALSVLKHEGNPATADLIEVTASRRMGGAKACEDVAE